MGEPDKTEHQAPWLTEESEVPADRTADGAHTSEAAESRPRKGGEEPDVLLDVPHLNVDEIDLEVDKLRARVALQARVLDLLQLDVGADVDLGGVRLDIKGVQAQALLKVRLDNVESIIERVLQTIDENPQIVEAAARTVADTAGGVADNLGRTAEGVTEGVGKAAEGVGGAAEGVGSAAEGAGRAAGGAGRAAEGAVGTASEAARDAAGSAGIPGARTAEEQTESADTTSGESEADQEGRASEGSGEAAGPERSDGGSDTEQDDGERSEAERETDGADPEAAIERPEDRTADDRPEDGSGGEQSEDDSSSEQPDAEGWDRTWAEAEQVLSAVGQRLLKGLGAGAKQVGREVGGAASRVVRAASEGG